MRVDEQSVGEVRAFNRLWTRAIGVLQAGLLDTPYSLTEARLLFELGQADSTDLVDLRRRLELDAGYVSRLLARFKEDGLVRAVTSPADGRRQVVSLTGRGREVFETLDHRSATAVSEMLDDLGEEDRRRLLAAMRTISDVVDRRPARPPYVLRPLLPGDLGWVVHRHGVLYAQEYRWDETFEALVARIVADYGADHDPKTESAWIAEIEGAPVGCVFCVRREEQTAQLRLLLVDPTARGLGIGARLVDECVRFATRTGYQRIVLWTNDVLVAARRIYEAAGFTLVDEEPHRSFGQDLVGQHWSLELPHG